MDLITNLGGYFCKNQLLNSIKIYGGEKGFSKITTQENPRRCSSSDLVRLNSNKSPKSENKEILPFS
ncbi:hypothetical protein L2E82_08091 [Cichorium intybus]|uniref:Uncharacterized protein n=1 Tax=Cichorium intybus TaxID=13427 RepID=A0ACB9G676_CICIN|nr:hypothetical protein L2E82_08091 [Cichorium intybus]